MSISRARVRQNKQNFAAYKGAGIIGGGLIQPLRIAATGGDNGDVTAASGNDAQRRIVSDCVMKTGGVAQTSLAPAFANYLLNASRAEISPGNAVTFRAHLRIDGAPTPVVLATFDGGAAQHVAADGEALFQTDEIPASAFGLAEIAPGTIVMVRTQCDHATAGMNTITMRPKYTAGGEQSVRGDIAATSPIGVAGALGTPTGYAAITNVITPIALLGRAKTAGAKSIILFGDSLTDGLGDDAGYGVNGGGFYPRAAWDIDGAGKAMPWARQAKSGTTAQQALANMVKQRQLWKYATDFVCSLGSNDAGARSAAQCFTDLQAIWAAAKAESVARVHQMRILARATGSSDSWATVAGQTIGAGFVAGGTFRDPLNASIAGSGDLAGVINVDLNWSDPVQNDRIRAPGYTLDGVHPNATAAAAMKAQPAAYFNAL